MTPEAIADDLLRPVPSSGLKLNRLAGDALRAQAVEIARLHDALESANKAGRGMAATIARQEDIIERLNRACDKIIAEMNSLRRSGQLHP